MFLSYNGLVKRATTPPMALEPPKTGSATVPASDRVKARPAISGRCRSNGPWNELKMVIRLKVIDIKNQYWSADESFYHRCLNQTLEHYYVYHEHKNDNKINNP